MAKSKKPRVGFPIPKRPGFYWGCAPGSRVTVYEVTECAHILFACAPGDEAETPVQDIRWLSHKLRFPVLKKTKP
jgi:hypothetical protein